MEHADGDQRGRVDLGCWQVAEGCGDRSGVGGEHLLGGLQHPAGAVAADLRGVGVEGQCAGQAVAEDFKSSETVVML
ncbi:hypothetical protein GCM10009738_76910 [Kitasatospora viridis]